MSAFINLQAAIDRYGVCRRTLYNWIRGGQLERRRKGAKLVLVHTGDIERQLAAARENPLRQHLARGRDRNF